MEVFDAGEAFSAEQIVAKLREAERM